MSPGKENEKTRRDVEKLPLEELRKQAGALTQKLERRSPDRSDVIFGDMQAI